MLQKVMTYCLAVGAALWIAVISTGVTIEHHCAHCCQEHEAHHEAACDHCEECWTICLQVSQYDLAQDWQVPAPEITQLLKTGYEALIISNLQEIRNHLASKACSVARYTRNRRENCAPT